MKIRIENNKHLCFFFQPRSGSTLLINYIADLTDRLNYREILNLYNPASKTLYDGANVHFFYDKEPKGGKEYIDNFLKEIKDLEKNNQYVITKSLLGSLIEHYPEIILDLETKHNFQFFNLERADVLYGLLSHFIALSTKKFHKFTDEIDKTPYVIDETNKFHFYDKLLIERCKEYVKEKKFLMEKLPNVPTIYYEQFEKRPTNILNLFENLPKKIIAAKTQKILGNYRSVAINYKELEDVFVDFVLENKEFFPQYFIEVNGLPKIPLRIKQD